MKREAAWRIEEARLVLAFADINDLAGRAQLTGGHLNILASANALESLTGNRRQTMWQAVGSVPDKGLLRSAFIVEEELQLAAPSEAENIVADYRTSD